MMSLFKKEKLNEIWKHFKPWEWLSQVVRLLGHFYIVFILLCALKSLMINKRVSFEGRAKITHKHTGQNTKRKQPWYDPGMTGGFILCVIIICLLSLFCFLRFFFPS